MKFFTVSKMIAILMFANTIGYLLYWVIFDAVVPLFMTDFQYINYNGDIVKLFVRGIVSEICVWAVMTFVIFQLVRDVHNDLDANIAKKRIFISNIAFFALFWLSFVILPFTMPYTAMHPLAFGFINNFMNDFFAVALSSLIVTVINIIVLRAVYSFAYNKTAPVREQKLIEMKQREELAMAARKELGE